MIKIICKSILISAAFALTATATNNESKNFSFSKNLELFNSLFRELDIYYVDTINTEKLIQTATDEMLSTLDPYTTFIPKEESEDFMYMTTGEYGGIGAIIRALGNDTIVISEPYEGKPADKAGLKAGDILIEIDGEKCKGKSVSDVSDMLRGQPNEIVKIKFLRPGEDKCTTKNITREKIIVNPVDYYGVYDNIAYLHLTSFTDKASAETKKALQKMETENKQLEGFILDLRGNPGGLIDEAISICNLFLPKDKVIVSTKGKNTQWDQTYKTTREPIDEKIPMVILVDGSSASAAEIVSGAMQDMDRAVIIGEQTYGKGLVQTTRPIGYDSYLKVTTAKYYTPSGRCIQAREYDSEGNARKIPDTLTSEFKTQHGRIVRDGGGIKPDIELKDSTQFSTLVYKLYTENYIFNYVTEYCQKHKKPTSVDDITFDDKDFDDFKAFLTSKNFSYQLKSEKVFNDLKEFLKFEGYDEILSDVVKKMDEGIKPNLEQDLEHFKEDIIQTIRTEIALRYFYQWGSVKETLKYDDGIKKAIETLKDTDLYNKTLHLK